jgi:hypothetical protein
MKSERNGAAPEFRVIARSEATRRSRGHGLKCSVKNHFLSAARAAPGSLRFARDDVWVVACLTRSPRYALTPIKWQIANTKSARFIV